MKGFRVKDLGFKGLGLSVSSTSNTSKNESHITQTKRRNREASELSTTTKEHLLVLST